MDYRERTKVQLLEDIKALNQQFVDVKKDLEILHTITDAVHQSFDLQHIYHTALDMVITLQDVDMAFIYLVSQDREEAVIQAHRNLTDDYIRGIGRILYPKGVTWKVLNSGQVFNIEDIQKDKDVGPAGKRMGHRRALGIPIILEGSVMGVIWLASYKKGKFSKKEIELNVSIGNHIGIAIGKAKLYEEMGARVKERTAELEKTNLLLKQEIEERRRAETEIRIVHERHEFLDSLRRIVRNEQDDAKAEPVPEYLPHESLSNREYEVMIMTVSGMKIKDIAKQMYLSISTIGTYRKRIHNKLNLKTTAELIAYAIKNDLRTLNYRLLIKRRLQSTRVSM